MAKKKKDPLAQAARQVVKETAKQTVKKSSPKPSAQQKAQNVAKKAAGNLVKKKAPGATGETVKKKQPAKQSKPFKASNISSNTGRSVTKQDRQKQAKQNAARIQAKKTAKSNVTATQRGEKIMGGNAVQRKVLGKYEPKQKISQADAYMLGERQRNEVNNAKALYNVARRNNDEAGMKLAHGLAELARLNNPMERRNDGNIVGPYSGGTWGDRYIEANMGDFNPSQTGLKEPRKNFLKSEGYQVKSALNEAKAGYLNTLLEFPASLPEGQGSSQLVVRGDNEDKFSRNPMDRRGQSTYTEEDLRRMADQATMASQNQTQLGYQTTPIDNAAGRFLGDATRVATGIGLDALANSVIPGSGLVNMGARTWGSQVKQAKDEQRLRGTDNEPFADLKAYMYGTAMTGVEVATEKMFDGVKLFGKSVYGAGGATTKFGKALDDVFNAGINKAVGRLAKTPGGEAAISALMNIGKSGLEEGLEELVADFAQWQMPKIYGGDVEGAKEMLSNALYDFALGAAMGGFGGVTSARATMREAYSDRAMRNIETSSDRLSKMGADKEQAKQALGGLNIDQLEALAETSDEDLLTVGKGLGLFPSKNGNQSPTEASEEQSSEQTFEGEQAEQAEQTPKAEVSRGKAWDALRSRLRDSGIRNAEQLRMIRDRLTPEEMEEAANSRKNDFLEWRDRVTSPDYQPTAREEAEPAEEITAEEDFEEEDDGEIRTEATDMITSLGERLTSLGVKGAGIAKAIGPFASGQASVEDLRAISEMDESQLRAWAQEQGILEAPATEEQKEALREQETALKGQAREVQGPVQETAQATSLDRAARAYGKKGAEVLVGMYDPGKPSDIYMREMAAAYNAGFTGNARPVLHRVLSKEQSQAMYNAGRLDSITSMQGRNVARRNAVSFDKETAGIDLEDNNLKKMIEAARDYGGTVYQFNERDAKHLNRLLKSLGKKAYFVESIDDKDDSTKKNIANGSYADGIVLLSLQSERPITFVIGHEITHAMAEMSPREYKQLERHIASMDNFETRVSDLVSLYEAHGMTISRETAVEEVVADYVGQMVNEMDLLEEFARRADRNLLQKFLDALRAVSRKLTGKDKTDVDKAIRLVEKMLDSSVKQNKRMEKTKSSAEEILANMTESKNSIKSMFDSAGLNAEQKDGRIVATDKNGKQVTKVTTNMVRESGIGALINYAYEETGTISKEDAETQLEGARDLLNMMLNAQDGELVWRFAGSAMFSAVKSNSDGQYGTTIDFSTVCRKTQEMMTAMSDSMMKLGRGLTKDEVIELQADILTEKGTVPCPVCYVFSRWAGVGGILDNMAKFQKKYGHEYDDPAKLNARIEQLEKATSKKANLREMLMEHDSVYIELAGKQEELQADNKKKKQEIKNLNKKKPDGYEAMVRDRERAIRMNDAQIAQAKEDMKKLEAEGAPELAWLKKVRSDPNYWNEDGGGFVDEKVLFNLDDAATFAEKYPIAWKYRTTRGPSAGKAILPYSDMRLGDLILGAGKNSAQGKDTFKTVENGEFNGDQIKAIGRARQRTLAQNLIGGQRFQSTSDFRYDYGLDYLQVFWEAQALGTNMQTYTKIVEFAELAAAVGGDVNLSVMPLNNGLDENGNLLYSSVTGMDIEAAKKANEMYDNVQLILVGINDEHILTALDDESDHGGMSVGFVIPYHASGASINKFIRGLVENLRETFNEDYYKDYSPVQEDSKKKIPGAKEETVKAWMEAMRENPSKPQFTGRQPNAKQRKALEQRLRHEIRAALLKHKIGGSSVAADKFINDNLEFFRGTSKDISDMSFEELRDIEQKALSGDADAIAEYESWSNGFLWDIYQKMWVDESAADTYGVTLNTAQAGSVMPHEYWNKNVDREHAYINGFLFRSYCYNLGLTPRFTGINSAGKNVGYGDFSISKGYWKTLIDRPMYDNQGRYRDQQKLNVTEVTKSIGKSSQSEENILTPEYGEREWGDYKVQEPSDERARKASARFVERKQGQPKLSAKRTGVSPYVTKEMDDAYMEAVQAGDMETVERMVREAAEAAGYPTHLFHGTNRFGWTKPDTKYSDDGISFFASTSEETAGSYTGEKNVRRVGSTKGKRKSAGRYMYKDLRFDSEEDLEEFRKAFPTYTPQAEIDELEDEIDSYDSDEYDRIDDLRREFLDAMDAYRKYDWSHSRPTSFREFRDNPDKYGVFDVERAVLAWDPNMGLFDFFEDPYGTPVGDLISDMFYGFEEYASEEDNDWTFDKILDITFPGRVPEGESFQEKAQGVYDLFANTNNMEEIDGHGAHWNGIMYRGKQMSTRDISRIVRDEGKRDGVIIRNIYDTAGSKALPASDIYIFHNPARQVKSADPVTYDDDGNVIPLSERFDPDKPDIRWSISGGLSYDEYIARYGSIKPGERRARDIKVPQRTSETNKVHQGVRTIMEAGRTPEEILPRLKEMIESGEFSYEVFGNREAVENAQNVVSEKGFAVAYGEWSEQVGKGIVSASNVAMGWVLYDTAIQNKDWKTVARIAHQMAKVGNTLGQGLQAMRILKLFSPEMQLAVMDGPKPEHVQKKIDAQKKRPLQEGEEDFRDLFDEEDEDYEVFMGEEKEKPAAPKKPRKKPQRKPKPAEEEDTQTDEEEDTEITQKDVEDTALFQAQQAKATFLDKWNAWRYLAMLFNPRTHIRNVAGNALFAPVVMTKNATATAAEIAVYYTIGKRHGMQRTKGFYLNPKLFSYAWKDYDEMKPVIMSEKFEGQDANDEKTYFRFKPLEAARKFNSAALNVEDAWFSKPHYANALAQFMAANGITVEMMETGFGEIQRGPYKGQTFSPEIMDRARKYAVLEAQKATYRDLNDLSEFFMRVGKPKNDDNKVERGMHLLVEGVIPFRKTPANILCRAMEYSPVGFLHGMEKLVFEVPRTYRVQKKVEALQQKRDSGEELTDKEKKYLEKSKEFKPTTVAEALDRLCSGMSGTAIFALGMYLAKMGLLVAKTDNGDDNEKYFLQLLGHQQWAIEAGGYSFTIDWMAPEVVPLFMGAQFFTGFREGDPIRNFSNLAGSVSMVIDPVMELSCMSGISEALNNFAKFSEGDVNTMVSVGSTLALSYFTQGIPTLFGQFERTFQGPYRMQTFTQDEQLIPADWQYQIGKISAKIPGWDYHQIPYVDSWGNTETETKWWKRLVANMLNPAYIKKIDTRSVNKELQRLYDATGNGNVLPKPGWKTYKYEDENGKSQTVYLSAEEYLTYSRAKGRNQFDLVSNFIKSNAYKSMTNSDRSAVISEIYNYAEYKAQSEYINNFRGESKGYKVDDYIEFVGQHGNKLGFVDYIVLDKNLDGVKGLYSDSYQNGKKAISYTKSDNLIINIHRSGVSIPTDQKEYEDFMSTFGVSDSQKGWSLSMAEADLAKQKKKYGITD